MDVNPYQPAETVTEPELLDVNTVQVRVFDLLSRGHGFIKDRYWFFTGVSVAGILLGSFVPFGILIGPMLIGIFIALIYHERRQPSEFSILFKGFDQFGESIVLWLLFMAASLLMVPVYLLLFGAVVLVAVMLGEDGGGPNVMVGGFITMYPLIILLSIAAFLPFSFAFPLMADRKLPAIDAVKTSWRGVRANFWGVAKFMISNWIISMILTLMCYVPAFFFMPISLAAIYVLYRDIFGPLPKENPYPYTIMTMNPNAGVDSTNLY